MITALLVIIWVVVLVLLWQLSKQKVKFVYRNLLAVFLGASIGFAIYSLMPSAHYIEFKNYLKTISNIYIRGLQMMIVPIVFISISTAITTIGKETQMGKRFGLILVYFAVSILAASMISLGTAELFNLSDVITANLNLHAEVSQSVGTRLDRIGDASFGKVIYGLTERIPRSIFDAFSKNNIVGVLIVALLFGQAIRFLSKRHSTEMLRVNQGLQDLKLIINSITITIIKLTPYGVFALITTAVADQGSDLFGGLISFILISYVTMFIIVLVHSLFMSTQGLNPFKHFRNLLPAFITAFSTQSSGATLPVTIDTLENRNGVDQETANIAGSLGTTMGMNACGAMWPTFMIVLAVAVTNIVSPEQQIELYSVGAMLTLLIAVLISSFGIAGLPGTASFAAITAMTIFNVSPEVIGIVLTFVLSVDSLIDMGRTATNVYGVSSAATYTSSAMKTLNKEVFDKKN